MARDIWDGTPDTRRKYVTAKLAEVGIGRDGEKLALPPSDTAPPRDWVAELDQRDGFIQPPGGMLISPTLAQMLHYEPNMQKMHTASDATENPISDEEAELASMEAMRR